MLAKGALVKVLALSASVRFVRSQTHFRWARKKCLLGSRMHRRSSFPVLFLIVLVFLLRGLCAASSIQERTDRFLKLTNAGYQALFRVNSEAQWLAVTDVT